MTVYLQLFVECSKCKRFWNERLSLRGHVEDVEKRAFKAHSTCHNCGNKFTLPEGVLNHFLSNNLFAAYIIRSSWVEGGHCNVRVGRATSVEFATKPAKIFNVLLTPTHRVVVEPSLITTNGFTIVSSCQSSQSVTSTVVNWTGFGEARDHYALPWKEALANSKGYELQKDTNMEVVTAETAFELFIDDFLQQHLKAKSDTLHWILRRLIEEKTAIWYAEATGQRLAKQYIREYQVWQQYSKGLRDSIVHRKSGTNFGSASSHGALDSRCESKACQNGFFDKSIGFVQPHRELRGQSS